MWSASITWRKTKWSEALAGSIIGPIGCRIAEKPALFGEEKSPIRLVELGYKLLSYPPYSPDLSQCDFYLFPNLEVTCRTEFLGNWWGYWCHWGLVCRPPTTRFFRRVKEVKALLSQVYQAKTKLGWSQFFPNICFHFVA